MLVQSGDDPEALVAELLREPEPRRRERIATDPRFRLLKVCEILATRSRELWFEDPARSMESARLAVTVAEFLDEAGYGRGLVADARALACAHLGNAHRITSDLWRAEEALREAEAHHVVAGVDPLVRAEILSFQASLRDMQGRFHESAQLLDRTIAIYRAAGERHREGRALIQKATVLASEGKVKDALIITRRGLPKLSFWREPQALLAARHNLTTLLAADGSYLEAFETLRKTRRLTLELGEPQLYLVKLRWLEANLASQLGRLDQALAGLVHVRQAFIERGLSLDVAVVSLDLAVVQARLGRKAEARRLVLEAIPLFESRGMRQDVLAALLLFKDVAF
ncbi:MAG TPA: hypothetical protein VEL74_23545 [Thermoanaerobaculia bacterium]|nr:hypothetical protein [Thermoanaerobaculia bacterium]